MPEVKNQYDDIWDPFADDTLVAVSCPTPENFEEAILRLLARKLGTLTNDAIRMLYGNKALAGADTRVYDADRAKCASGEKYLVPKWLTQIGPAFREHYNQEIEEAKKRGVYYGKRLLHQLASGEISVDEFERNTWF